MVQFGIEVLSDPLRCDIVGLSESGARQYLGIVLTQACHLAVNAANAIGHYLVGWPFFDSPGFAIGIVFLVIGIAAANMKRSNS